MLLFISIINSPHSVLSFLSFAFPLPFFTMTALCALTALHTPPPPHRTVPYVLSSVLVPSAESSSSCSGLSVQRTNALKVSTDSRQSHRLTEREISAISNGCIQTHKKREIKRERDREREHPSSFPPSFRSSLHLFCPTIYVSCHYN